MNATKKTQHKLILIKSGLCVTIPQFNWNKTGSGKS